MTIALSTVILYRQYYIEHFSLSPFLSFSHNTHSITQWPTALQLLVPLGHFPVAFPSRSQQGFVDLFFFTELLPLFLLLPRDWERNQRSRKAKQSRRRAVAKAMEFSQECRGKMLSDKVPLWTFLLMELQIISNLSTLQTRLAADQVIHCIAQGQIALCCWRTHQTWRPWNCPEKEEVFRVGVGERTWLKPRVYITWWTTTFDSRTTSSFCLPWKEEVANLVNISTTHPETQWGSAKVTTGSGDPVRWEKIKSYYL